MRNIYKNNKDERRIREGRRNESKKKRKEWRRWEKENKEKEWQILRQQKSRRKSKNFYSVSFSFSEFSSNFSVYIVLLKNIDI